MQNILIQQFKNTYYIKITYWTIMLLDGVITFIV